MCKTDTVEALQTLGCPIQLLSRFSVQIGGISKATRQLQSVSGRRFNVPHDGPVLHPNRHANELALFYVFLSTNKLQDVWMG